MESTEIDKTNEIDLQGMTTSELVETSSKIRDELRKRVEKLIEKISQLAGVPIELVTCHEDDDTFHISAHCPGGVIREEGFVFKAEGGFKMNLDPSEFDENSFSISIDAKSMDQFLATAPQEEVSKIAKEIAALVKEGVSG